MKLSDAPLLSVAQIEWRIGELASDISARYAGKEPILIVVLKGAGVFAVDLMRRMSVPSRFEYIRARSYAGTESRGHVEITVMPDHSLANEDLIVVEDILDTGRTTHAVMERLRQENPASLALCTLLDKPSRRVMPVKADFTGFQIDNVFVVGYGLDFNDRYRALPDIRVLEE
ncbi:MAG: hypoxanthine phosphoribosyltransferase [FCB group bacterium]|jgi:hypoxanthine phosphoribosyltransferase|nr:hypoxanthine phosphoribosyltransferase [FCB group bacterium]